MNRIIVTAMIVLPVLIGIVPASVQVPIPHGIRGIVYLSDGITEASWGTNFSVNDTVSGEYIEGTTGAGPHSGWYSVSINGNDGDLVILRAWNATHYGERIVLLVGDMTNIAVILNNTIPSKDSFDTGLGAYPSISGTHRGTIMPSRTINVSKLYTYPCAGTGGHTEYVQIYGNGIDKSASWTEYNGDWHNISFDKPFTLEAGKTYNYEIRTGSYPQIIHAESKNVTGGVITCQEFVDANGRPYKDEIPAMRLS
jgi:hypothetical protein